MSSGIYHIWCNVSKKFYIWGVALIYQAVLCLLMPWTWRGPLEAFLPPSPQEVLLQEVREAVHAARFGAIWHAWARVRAATVTKSYRVTWQKLWLLGAITLLLVSGEIPLLWAISR